MAHKFSDFLTRVRNAGNAQRRYVDVPVNGLIREVIKILERKGYIDRFNERQEGPLALSRIFLRYDENKQPYIQRAQSISTSGRRKYIGASKIRPVLGGLGISVLSTSRGVMTGSEAKRQNVGGELLCHIAFMRR